MVWWILYLDFAFLVVSKHHVFFTSFIGVDVIHSVWGASVAVQSRTQQLDHKVVTEVTQYGFIGGPFLLLQGHNRFPLGTFKRMQ